MLKVRGYTCWNCITAPFYFGLSVSQFATAHDMFVKWG